MGGSPGLVADGVVYGGMPSLVPFYEHHVTDDFFRGSTGPMQWEEVEERLCAMPRFTTRALSDREKKEILSEHLEHLDFSTRRQFIALLESMPGVTLDSTFEEVEAALGRLDDPRAKLLEGESKREAVDSLIRRLVADAARQFKALLENDVAKITPARSGPSFDKALRLMRRDKRWRALDGHAEVRDELILEYIDGGASDDEDAAPE